MMQSLYTASTGMMQCKHKSIRRRIILPTLILWDIKNHVQNLRILMYKVMTYAGTSTSDTTKSPTGIEVGLGVRPTAITKIFSEGSLKQTDNPLDLAITGKGFLKLQLPNGTEVYTRNGALKIDENGTLVNSDGYTVIPEIVIPDDAIDISIGTDGIVSVTQPGQAQATQVGQLTLTNFINPAGLHALGDNLFLETDSSGQPVEGIPGDTGLGVIRQGFVELSNVQLVVELTDLITGQRAYDANSKVITTSDEMLATTNGLKR